MITLALVAALLGGTAVLGMTGLLVVAFARPTARLAWRSAATIGLVGLVVLVASVTYLVSQVGPGD